jgi:beta-glucosidase
VSQIVELCNMAINAITDAGGMAVVKHLLGHGRAVSDSHLVLPMVDNSIQELMDSDFAIFKQLSQNPKLEWAMTAHIVFDAIDIQKPVTLSKKAISFIRNEIGFKGTIITDDICMFALHKNIDFGELDYHSLSDITLEKHANLYQRFIDNLVTVTKASFDAGCQYVLHCSGNLQQMQAIYRAI